MQLHVEKSPDLPFHVIILFTTSQVASAPPLTPAIIIRYSIAISVKTRQLVIQAPSISFGLLPPWQRELLHPSSNLLLLLFKPGPDPSPSSLCLSTWIIASHPLQDAGDVLASGFGPWPHRRAPRGARSTPLRGGRALRPVSSGGHRPGGPGALQRRVAAGGLGHEPSQLRELQGAHVWGFAPEARPLAREANAGSGHVIRS